MMLHTCNTNEALLTKDCLGLRNLLIGNLAINHLSSAICQIHVAVIYALCVKLLELELNQNFE